MFHYTGTAIYIFKVINSNNRMVMSRIKSILFLLFLGGQQCQSIMQLKNPDTCGGLMLYWTIMGKKHYKKIHILYGAGKKVWTKASSQMLSSNPQRCSWQWDENPIMSATKPSSDLHIQEPRLLRLNEDNWGFHILFWAAGRQTQAAVCRKNHWRYYLNIIGSAMRPSSLYWCYMVRSQIFHLNIAICCCKEVHRFSEEKLLLLTVICFMKATAWLHLSPEYGHPVTSSMVFPSCIVVSFPALHVGGHLSITEIFLSFFTLYTTIRVFFFALYTTTPIPPPSPPPSIL